MSWFTRKPSAEMKAVEAVTEKVMAAAEERKSAMGKLLEALDRIPLDDAILKLGSDLTDVKRNGH